MINTSRLQCSEGGAKIKKLALIFLILLPTVSLPMLLPTARQLARVAVASSMRQNLYPVIHDASLFAHKRWYAAAQKEMQQCENSGEDRAALEKLLRESRYKAKELRELQHKSIS